MGQMKEAIASIDDRDLDRITAIIRSMTPGERQDPKILNGSRRLRIARGSGTTVNEVNRLVERFYEARKVMKQMAGGMPGMRRPSSRKSAKGKKGNSKRGRASMRSGGLPPNLGLPPGMKLPPGLAPDLSNLKLPGSD
jgi:signal recognition particle subunit SRP54